MNNLMSRNSASSRLCIMRRYFVFLMMAFLLSSVRLYAQTSTETGQSFAVVELYTSQGCSSCPPADALLRALGQEGDDHIIPLSYHVDYWNYIGWADPFSQPDFGERQRTQARRLGHKVYTPQVFVNNQTSFVGSNQSTLKRSIERALSGRSGARSCLLPKNNPCIQSAKNETTNMCAPSGI